MSTATITSKGQITLPKSIRDHLHVDQGDQLEFVIAADGRVRVQRLAGSAKRLRGILQRPGRKPLTVEEMDQSMMDYLTEEDERIRRQGHAHERDRSAAR